MSLTLRNTKGSPLTYTEMDDNLTYLENLGTTSGEQDLASVLAQGNETGGNDIILSDGDTIGNSNGSLEFVEVIGGGVISTDSIEPLTGGIPGINLFSYTITPNSTSGSGTGLTVQFIRNTTIPSIGILSIIDTGQGYEVGDTITFLGTQFGLTTPADDETYTITEVTTSTQGLKINSENIILSTESTISIGGVNTFNNVSNVIALGTFGSNLTQSDRVYITNPVIKTESTPSSTADSSGVQGEVRYDSDYIYIKTAAGWKRTALSTF